MDGLLTTAALREQLLSKADEYCRMTGASKSTIGKLAINDPAFLSQVENGRNLTFNLYDKVMDWLTSNWPAAGGETVRPADQFRKDIEEFLAASGMSAAAFGMSAVGDPNFVYEVRAGRSATLRMVERVAAFIASWAPSEEASQERAAS